jgi:2-polyprenyl-3-methyl-5-hydroxy-6-metoxy-1,4-benzoquinol methylase
MAGRRGSTARKDYGQRRIICISPPSLASVARARSLDKVLDWHLPHFAAADFALLANDGENGLNGGYEDGYSRCPCFWGRSAGSLVQRFLSDYSFARGLRVLDLGSGEGKNAFAFASAGAVVVAVDCSALGLANGQREFAGSTPSDKAL